MELDCNSSLGLESDKVCLLNAVSAHAFPDSVAVIICGISIEVTAMPILAFLWAHLNHDIDEVAFFFVSPLVDLNESAVIKIEVQHLEILTKLAVRLQNLTMIIVSDIKAVPFKRTRELAKN